jgi:hypothetical protein
VKSELRLYFPKLNLRWGVLALLALVLQAVAIFVPLDLDDVPKRVLFVLSYLLLVVFILKNLRHPGMVVIGIGLLLNLLPIISNGGLMPVTAEHIAEIGQTHSIEGKQSGDAIPYTKNLLKAEEDTYFYELSDRIVWDNPFFFRVFSIGDIVIVAGLAILLAECFLPRVQRRVEPTGGEPSG